MTQWVHLVPFVHSFELINYRLNENNTWAQTDNETQSLNNFCSLLKLLSSKQSAMPIRPYEVDT